MPVCFPVNHVNIAACMYVSRHCPLLCSIVCSTPHPGAHTERGCDYTRLQLRLLVLVHTLATEVKPSSVIVEASDADLVPGERSRTLQHATSISLLNSVAVASSSRLRRERDLRGVDKDARARAGESS